LSEAAKLNIASAAWQVRGRLGRALVDFYAVSEQQRLLAAQQVAPTPFGLATGTAHAPSAVTAALPRAVACLLP
jgi:hypothetical protein